MSVILSNVDFSWGLAYRHGCTVCTGGHLQRASPSRVSELLNKWQEGDREALPTLVPLVYADLRKLARRYLRQERPEHTLQSTALVHEAYLRLAQREKIHFESRTHFFAVSAQLMRQILVDHARGHNANKRGAGLKLTLDEALAPSPLREVNLVALDDALQELTRLDARQGQIVELRFFGGLSIDETSQILGISPATVKREWMTARLWLQKQLTSAQPV
jgi:RNA polymerase sigma factor (TIGR02999 family)